MSTTDDDVQQKQQLLRNLLRRQREIDAEALGRTAAPAAPAASAAAPTRWAEPAPQTRPAPRPTAPIRAPARPDGGFDTSIIDGATMDRIGVAFVRGAALVLLGVGIFGSILAFDGDWTPAWRFWQGISPLAAIAGVGLQLEITVVEWWRGRKQGFDLAYWSHLLLDASLMLWGWWPVVGTLLTNTIARTMRAVEPLASLADWAVVPTFALLAAGAFLIARQPERWLVRR